MNFYEEVLKSATKFEFMEALKHAEKFTESGVSTLYRGKKDDTIWIVGGHGIGISKGKLTKATQEYFLFVR